jgi:hypothetical protein
MTKLEATLAGDGRTFEEVAASRANASDRAAPKRGLSKAGSGRSKSTAAVIEAGEGVERDLLTMSEGRHDG